MVETTRLVRSAHGAETFASPVNGGLPPMVGKQILIHAEFGAVTFANPLTGEIRYTRGPDGGIDRDDRVMCLMESEGAGLIRWAEEGGVDGLSMRQVFVPSGMHSITYRKLYDLGMGDLLPDEYLSPWGGAPARMGP